MMRWYDGTMAEAVNLCKQRNAIFVVFVEDDNDLSKELAATIDDAAVVQKLINQKYFLAVKLKSGSENYTYFAQIYQFVPVPSLFFLGRNGTPLEVVCAGVEPQNLATRIDRILQEHHEESKTPQPSTSSQNVKAETSSFIQAEASAQSTSAPAPDPQPVPKPDVSEPVKSTTKNAHDETAKPSEPAAKIAKTEEKPEYEVVCDGDVCVRRPVDQAGPSQTETVQKEPMAQNESETNVEEKMQKAKELIEIRRREKAAKEKEEEKQKEIERRSVGQGVAELKKWQADQELKQIQEDRKREKLENNLARQRILEQIAQDRAERKAREQPPTTLPVQPNIPAAVGDTSGRARVQFKLPDGEAHTAHFDASASLGDVQRYVADNLQLSTSSFSLWTAFPRRELTETSATLSELQLAPSAALLVLPRRTTTVAASPSPFASVIAFLTQLFTSFVLDPSYQLYSWIRNRIFPTNPTIPVNPSSPVIPSNPVNPSNQGVRRRGNIHRITGDRTGDDDNNTWNGNSTQQM